MLAVPQKPLHITLTEFVRFQKHGCLQSGVDFIVQCLDPVPDRTQIESIPRYQVGSGYLIRRLTRCIPHFLNERSADPVDHRVCHHRRDDLAA